MDWAPFVGEVLVDDLRDWFEPLTRLLQPLQNGAGGDGHAVEIRETFTAIRFTRIIYWILT